MQLLCHRVEAPIGPIWLVSDGEALCALEFADHKTRLLQLLHRYYGTCGLREDRAAARWSGCIGAYFEGDLMALDSIAVRMTGSAFQLRVWAALRRIPVGTTTTYGQLAAQIGRPSAARAVGLANGANPLAIVVPCHRVIGADGSLTGYGGGLARKAWLLRHERAAVGAEGASRSPNTRDDANTSWPEGGWTSSA